MATDTHSIESDLRAAREAAGLSIEDIHQETRLATDIIKRFEAGELIGDPSFNAVYLKAFLRSYTASIGIGQQSIDAALESARNGTYNGELHPSYSSDSDEASLTEETEVPAIDSDKQVDVDAAPKVPAFPKVGPLSDPSPVSSEAIHYPPVVPSYSDTRPARRLQKKDRSSPGRAFDTAWGAIVGVTVLVVLAVFAILWLLFRGDSREPDVMEPTNSEVVETASMDSAASETLAQSPAPQITFPVEVTVIAAGNGLQSFRVTELPSERRPVWVEPGESITFSGDQGVILWGEGGEGMNPEEVTLRFRGYEWKPPVGQVLRIDRIHGQALLDSLYAVFPDGGSTPPQP